MWEIILTYLGVMGMTALKFMPGAALAIVAGMGFFEQIIVTTAGGTMGAAVSTYLGAFIKEKIQHFKQRRRIKRDSEAFQKTKKPKKKKKKEGPSLSQKVWDRFGLVGVALLTPPFFTPPIGPALAVGFGANKHKVVLYMFVSMLLWSILFAFLGEAFVDAIIDIGLMSPDSASEAAEAAKEIHDAAKKTNPVPGK